MGCFSKFFLFVLNFIVFAMGVAVIVLASLILSHGSEFQTLISEGTFTVPIVLLIMGIIVMIIGFFGCFGALRESPCLLYTYAAIVLVLFIAQVAVGVYAFVAKDDLSAFVSDNMVKVFNKFGGDDTELTTSLNLAQHNLQCCGVTNYTDWFNTMTSATLPKGDVPVGCCKVNATDDPNCNVGIQFMTVDEAEAKIYTKGCFTSFVDIIEKEALLMIIGAIVLGLVQLGCVIIACGIGKRSSSEHHVY